MATTMSFQEPHQDATKTLAQKPSSVMAMATFDEDGETTDMGGAGSASETESASGMSSTESSHSVCATGFGKHCRFGSTPLETIPATPVSRAAPTTTGSPTGLTRAALRQARDAFNAGAMAGTSHGHSASSPNLPAFADGSAAVALSSSRRCRFGKSPWETVPATPPKQSAWKAMAKALGSPPGLSRASMRQERDACKIDALPAASWGSCQKTLGASTSPLLTISPGGAPMTLPALRSAKRHAAREAVMLAAREGAASLKAEADLLKKLKSHLADADADEALKRRSMEVAEEAIQQTEGPAFIDDLSDSEETADAGSGSISEESASESSTFDGRRCRFGGTALETVPATPVGAGAKPSLPSPPGLSRASMRQARDACKAEVPSWGDSRPTGPLTINPCGKPMTPPALRSAKRRTMRDAVMAPTRSESAFTWFSTSSAQTVTKAVPR